MNGITVTTVVPAGRAPETLLDMVEMAHEIDRHLHLKPHELPIAEQVPGGTPVDGTAGVYDTEGRAGSACRGSGSSGAPSPVVMPRASARSSGRAVPR